MIPFRFVNRRGQVVKGVRWAPRGGQARTGFLYVPGIVLGSIAVHRLGIEIGRQLAERGHPVCLFDPAGTGESEGEHPRGTNDQLSAWVEAGNLVDDTLQAIDVFARATGAPDVALVGHCGGALTAIYAAARHERAVGAFLLCPPTFRAGVGVPFARSGVADEYFALYRSKLWDWEAWRRLLAGRSNYRALFHALRSRLRLRAPTKRAASAPSASERSVPNEALARALREASAKGTRVLALCGDRDPSFLEFQRFRADHELPHVAYVTLGSATHGFVTEESMDTLMRELVGFVATLPSEESALPADLGEEGASVRDAAPTPMGQHPPSETVLTS